MSYADSSRSGSRWSISESESNSDCSMSDGASSDAESVDFQDVPQWVVGIDNLPFELLQMAFTYAQQYASDPITLPQTLSHVSKLWRYVALSSPILWATIHIQRGPSAVEEYLKRSGAARLDVHISLHPTVEKYDGVACIIQFSDLMEEHLYRIRRITFHVYHAIWISSFTLLGDLSRKIELDFLDLKILQYIGVTVNDATETNAACKGLNCEPKYLEIEGFPASNPNLFTNSLRSLKLSWQLDDYRTDVVWLVRQCLAFSPNLQYLQLTYTTIEHRGHLPIRQGETVFDLPWLREIVLEGVTPTTIQSLFRLINTPTLQTLLIDTEEPYCTIGSTLESATKQNPSIQRLHIKSCRLYLPSFWTILRNLPLLTDLAFTSCDVPWEELGGLVYKPLESPADLDPICPNLTSLTLEYDLNITHQALIMLIESRFNWWNLVSPIKSLTCRGPLISGFDPAVLTRALLNKVPELVLEVFGQLQANGNRFVSESRVEEEWIGENQNLDLDSGDEEVIQIGGRRARTRGFHF